MHAEAREEMAAILTRYNLTESGTVLDVGSLDVNGSYRDLVKAGKYIGVDIREGRGVDLVMADPRKIPVPAGTADLVISGSCIEHAEDPWALVKEMARACKAGGHVVIHAPFMWRLHNHPDDYWRFAPSGLRSLMERAGLNVLECYLTDALRPNKQDCYGVAVKPKKKGAGK